MIGVNVKGLSQLMGTPSEKKILETLSYHLKEMGLRGCEVFDLEGEKDKMLKEELHYVFFFFSTEKRSQIILNLEIKGNSWNY